MINYLFVLRTNATKLHSFGQKQKMIFDFLGHFYKLLYEDFEVYIEQIVVRSERVVRAPRLSDNLLYANRKPKDHKSA